MTRIPGARRLVTFDLEEVIELTAAVALRWDADAASVRSLRLFEKNRESDDVISFVFEARDAGPLQAFEAGQHLPIELEVPGLEGRPDAHIRCRAVLNKTTTGSASSANQKAWYPDTCMITWSRARSLTPADPPGIS